MSDADRETSARYDDAGRFIHHCHCRRWGVFGFGVSLKEGRLRRWCCREHLPPDLYPPASPSCSTRTGRRCSRPTAASPTSSPPTSVRSSKAQRTNARSPTCCANSQTGDPKPTSPPRRTRQGRAMTAARHRLPNRRSAETFELTVGGLRYSCTIGRFPDGSIGELFLENHKSNSSADTNARDAAITFSIAVQPGADIETSVVRCVEIAGAAPTARSAPRSTCSPNGRRRNDHCRSDSRRAPHPATRPEVGVCHEVPRVFAHQTQAKRAVPIGAHRRARRPVRHALLRDSTWTFSPSGEKAHAIPA
jgi:hypothetical protein